MENKPDLLGVIKSLGVEVHQKSRKFWACCPFHEDRVPSFVVDPDRQRYLCYGCGEKGDVISFVQRLHGLSFRDAIAFLGMAPGKEPKMDPVRKTKSELVRRFREWERLYRDKLTRYHQDLFILQGRFQTIEEMEEYADDYHLLPLVDHHLDILQNGSDEEKYQLCKEVTGG
ncbi:MAG TPA: CHC2 zinc finger domain-containing protein [Syntrophales bacterium]|nr:CHC2 zinc finger domain-containing protein [Syntrophales bacterium]